jgi:hypothetical protein
LILNTVAFHYGKNGCIYKGCMENIMNIIGIDVSKNKLDCALIDWLSKHIKSTVSEYHFVMEATGVYHEKCADWLFNAGSKVSVVNPRTSLEMN